MPSKYQQVIHGFIRERLESDLANIEKNKISSEKKEAKYLASRQRHEPSVWLPGAASLVEKTSTQTHVVKMTHPRAGGTGFRVPADTPSHELLLTTPTLGPDRDEGLAGDAKAAYIDDFLSLKVNNKTLHHHAIERTKGFVAALSDDPVIAGELCDKFAEFNNSSAPPDSHPFSKQLYWPVANNEYHLVAPISSSSLVHALYKRVDHWVYSKEAAALRKLQRGGTFSESPVITFPNLARQELGGSNPLNIGVLNQVRSGATYLLPSVPPSWTPRPIPRPLGAKSIFGRPVLSQKPVYFSVNALADYLTSVKDSKGTAKTKSTRQSLTDRVVDEVFTYAEALRAEPAGWSDDGRLDASERQWLDPRNVAFSTHASDEASDWEADVCRRFGLWLNSELRKRKLKTDDDSYRQWVKDFADALQWFTGDVK